MRDSSVTGADSRHAPAASDFWSRAIGRAEALAADDGPATDLLAFYAQLLRTQQTIAEELDRCHPSGSIEADAAVVARAATPLVHHVRDRGPARLSDEADTLTRNGDVAIRDALVTYWSSRSDRCFFAKAVTQPYAHWLVEAGLLAPQPRLDNRCPRCNGAPQLSILDAGAMSGDGGGRRLLCAICLAAWPFRRIVCPSCGEENEHRLGYFISPTSDHLRLDTCDTCGRYLKSIDLGRLGLAVPLVDEVAGVALDLWAADRGYAKVELNLLGL